MNKSPCYNCKYRTLSCHMVCEDYLKYKRIIESAKERRRFEAEAVGYTVDTVYKFKKARNLPQYR